jgi:hypothetical protein
VIGEIKQRFLAFKAQHETISTAPVSESDTGGGVLEKSRRLLEDEKDKRIKALEQEVLRLKDRERQLLDKLS